MCVCLLLAPKDSGFRVLKSFAGHDHFPLKLNGSGGATTCSVSGGCSCNMSRSCSQQGSLHYTPEHCLLNGGTPLYFGGKNNMFQMVAKRIF